MATSENPSVSQDLSRVTTDHKEIRRWAEERGGHPAVMRASDGLEDAGMLWINFPGYNGDGRLEPIEWDAFFEKFEENGLAFLYEEETPGGVESRFNKFVRREDSGQRRKAS